MMDVCLKNTEQTTNCTTVNDTITYNDTIEYDYDCDGGYLSPNSSMSSPYFYGAVYAMYCPILIIAVLGNGIVCFIVKSSPRMQTVTNFFITNLAVGDLLTAVFCVPFTFMSLFILNYWPFGAVMCPVVNYSQAVSVFVSAYTLVAISIDRYMAIMWPLKPRLTKRYAVAIIFVVWLFAIITALPIPIFSELTQPRAWYEQCDRYVCREVWPTQEQGDNYSMALTLLQYVIPVGVLIFTYTSIAIVVWCKRVPGEAENSRDQRLARSKRKMIKMMMTVVIVFTLCWLPFNLLIIFSYSKIDLNIPALPYMWLGLHWLAMSHSCYNPIIYCYMNARFRTGFFQVLASIPCCEKCSSFDAHRPRSSMGSALTGSDATENSLLQRVNTCSTYITMKHKKLSTYQHPVRSASVMRCSNGGLRRNPQTNVFDEDQI